MRESDSLCLPGSLRRRMNRNWPGTKGRGFLGENTVYANS